MLSRSRAYVAEVLIVSAFPQLAIFHGLRPEQRQRPAKKFRRLACANPKDECSFLRPISNIPASSETEETSHELGWIDQKFDLRDFFVEGRKAGFDRPFHEQLRQAYVEGPWNLQPLFVLFARHFCVLKSPSPPPIKLNAFVLHVIYTGSPTTFNPNPGSV